MNGAPLKILTGANVNLGNISGATWLRSAHLGDILLLGTVGTGTSQLSLTAKRDIQFNENVSANGGIIMVAGRDIITGIGNPGLNAANSNGGNIALIAGADYSETDTTITINGANLNGNGGALKLQNGTQLQVLDTSGSGGAAGNMNLVAYAGSVAGSGTIRVNPSITINANGSGAANGNISMVAGSNDPLGIAVGAINASSGTVGTGNITLSTSTPNDPVAGITISKTTNFGNPNAVFTGGAVQAADITTGNMFSQGGTVKVVAGRNVNLGNINASSSVNGGIIDIQANGTATLNINGAGPNRTGVLSTNAGAVGNGGTVSITNLGSTGINIPASSINQSVTDGNGSKLILNANNGTLTLPTTTFNVSGVGTNRDGGTISLRAATISAPAANFALTANGTGTGAGGTVFVETTTIGAGGNLSVGTGNGEFQVSASGANGLIDLRAGGALFVIDSNIVAANVNLRSNGPSSGIQINSGTIVDGSTGVTLTATGAGTINGNNALVSGGLLTINAGTGQSILDTSVNSLTFNTNGDVFIDEVNGPTINTSSAGVGSLQVNLSAGNLVIGGNVTANSVINLSTVGSGQISGAGTLISAGNLNMSTDTGAINVNTDVAGVSVLSGNTVTINEANAINLFASSGGNFRLSAGGAVTVSGTQTYARVRQSSLPALLTWHKTFSPLVAVELCS